MKIAVISSRFPYPLEKGDKLRLFHQLKYLATRHEVHLFAITDRMPGRSHREVIEKAGITLNIYYYPVWKRILMAGLRIFSSMPAQVAFFYNPGIGLRMKEDIANFHPDVVYCQLIRAAEYARKLPYPKLLDFMDAFSAIALKNYRISGIFSRLFFRMEYARILEYESKVGLDFEESIIISQRDKNILPGNFNPEVVPNGIDFSYFNMARNTGEFELLFVGNLGYGPNKLACRFVVKKIMPIMQKSRPLIRIHLAGARPVRGVKQLASNCVKISGWLEDIREAYVSGKVFVAPIFSGAGLQNKILEAMAMGIPCITTALVNESIGAEDGRDLLVAETPEEFCFCIDKLLDDPYIYELIRQNALKFVSSNFQWPVFNRKIDDILTRLAGRESTDVQGHTKYKTKEII